MPRKRAAPADDAPDAPPRRVLHVRDRAPAGRPPTPINWQMVRLARSRGCTWPEVAALVGVTPATLQSRIKAEGRQDDLENVAPALGRAIVKVKLGEIAAKGTVAALVYLDKKAADAEAAAAARANPAAGVSWLVEAPAVVPSADAWAEQYGPMRARPQGD